MYRNHRLNGFAIILLLLAGNGCDKEEQSPALPAQRQPKPTTAATNGSKPTIEPLNPTTNPTLSNTAAPTLPPVVAANPKAQELIDVARRRVAAKNYRDALAALRQAAGFKLTAEQKRTVEILRLQIQQGMAK